MTGIGEWIEELMSQVKTELEKAGIEGDATLQMVKKANDRELHTITIKSSGHISPVMYINELWDLHLRGESTRTLAEYVVDGYKGHCRKQDKFSDVLEDKEELKKHLRVRLVDAKYNSQYLKHCVSEEITAGLALIAEAHFADEDGNGYYSSAITEDLADAQNLDRKEVLAEALKNTKCEDPKLFVLSTNLFTDRPKNILGTELNPSDTFVLTTESQMNGVHMMATRSDVMNTIRMNIGDFWVVPSSRHEVLIMAKSQEKYTARRLIEMLREANREVVSDDDFFSDDLFQYIESGLERYEES